MAVTFNETLANAVSMAASSNSQAAILDHVNDVCIQCIYTGSPVGSLKAQASNNGTDWSDVTGSTVAVSAADNTVYNFANVAYIKLRIVYTRTSGTGSLTILCNGKGY